MAQLTSILLSESGAREIVTVVIAKMQIAGESLAEVRRLLVELYEGEGWRALGYASWRECVLAEFGQKQTWFYQQIKAAKIEKMLELAPGTLPETHARALAPLKTPEKTKAAYAKAQAEHGPTPTAPQIAQAVRAFSPVPKGSQGLKGKGAAGKFAEPEVCPTCRRPL